MSFSFLFLQSGGHPEDTGGPYQVRLKGIPFEATADEITKFLSDCAISGGDTGISILIGTDGRPSGEALVVLATHDDMVKALNHDRHHMGSRYIEVMFVSKEEYMKDVKDQPGSVSIIMYILAQGFIQKFLWREK